MGKKDYVEVGEILTRKNGKKYLVKEADIAMCTGCVFFLKHTGWCDDIKCTPISRTDNKSVIFIRRKCLEDMPITKLAKTYK